jgi:DNA-binding transcriptional regulator PaaX
VSPRDHAAEVIGYLKDLDITTGTAFRASSVPTDGEIPARAWDLDGLRQRYECFIAFAGQLRDAAAAGRVPPTDALIARTRVMDEWRAFPALDPDLPPELLPSAWPRATARALHRLLRPARAAGRAAGPADHHPVQPRTGRPGRLPQLGAEAEHRPGPLDRDRLTVVLTRRQRW